MLRVLSLAMGVLETDNEENALVALRMVFDLHKTYRPTLEGQVQPFLTWVQLVYGGLQEAVKTVLDVTPGVAGARGAAGSAMLTGKGGAPLTHDQLLAVKQVYSAQQQATAALVAYTEAATAAAQSDSAETDSTATLRFAEAMRAAAASKTSADAVLAAAIDHARALGINLPDVPAMNSTLWIPPTAGGASSAPGSGAGIPGAAGASVPSAGGAGGPPIGIAIGNGASSTAASGTAAAAIDPSKQASGKAPSARSGGPGSQKKGDGKAGTGGDGAPQLRRTMSTSSTVPDVATGMPLISCRRSFKVLTECPLIVMLLFQLYPKFINPNIGKLIPRMMDALALEAPASARTAHRARFTEFLACQVKTLSFLTYLLRGFAEFMKPFEGAVSPAVIRLLESCPPEAVSIRKEVMVATRHILATEFRKAFFADVDKFMSEDILIGPGRAAQSALRPLAYSTLADLVHHVRAQLSLDQLSRVIHMFSRNIHDPTLPITIQTTSVRLLLNLVDNTFHNNDPDGSKGRTLLTRILYTLVYKCGTLRSVIPRVLAAERDKAAEAKAKDDRERAFSVISHARPGTGASAADDGSAGDAPSGASGATAATASGVDTEGRPVARTRSQSLDRSSSEVLAAATTFASQYGRRSTTSALSSTQVGSAEPITDSVKDVKSLLKTMVLGLKTVVWCVSNYRRPTTAAPEGGATMTEQELRLVNRFLRWGVPCFSIYRDCIDPGVEEEKEVLDQFAGVFTVLDPHNFKDVFEGQIPSLFDEILADSAMLTIPQHLLANANAASPFVELLLGYLVERTHFLRAQRAITDATDASTADVEPAPRASAVTAACRGLDAPQADVVAARLRAGTVDLEMRASVALRLFKIVLGSVTHLFSDNEAVLRPHIQKIVLTTLRDASCVPYPLHHLHLLRAVFRSLTGRTKFETLLREFLPILSTLLNGLLRLQAHLTDPQLKNVVIELCLTVPARLGSLLPHLPQLMRPLWLALRSDGGPGSGDLVALGLKTLEFWIDNLNPEFLFPVLSARTGQADLLSALCCLLRPPPAKHGGDALRLLGKLGGKNRLFLDQPPELPFRQQLDAGLVVRLPWQEKGNSRLLPSNFNVETSSADVDMEQQDGAAGAGEHKDDPSSGDASAEESNGDLGGLPAKYVDIVKAASARLRAKAVAANAEQRRQTATAARLQRSRAHARDDKILSGDAGSAADGPRVGGGPPQNPAFTVPIDQVLGWVTLTLQRDFVDREEDLPLGHPRGEPAARPKPRANTERDGQLSEEHDSQSGTDDSDESSDSDGESGLASRLEVASRPPPGSRSAAQLAAGGGASGSQSSASVMSTGRRRKRPRRRLLRATQGGQTGGPLPVSLRESREPDRRSRRGRLSGPVAPPCNRESVVAVKKKAWRFISDCVSLLLHGDTWLVDLAAASRGPPDLLTEPQRPPATALRGWPGSECVDGVICADGSKASASQAPQDGAGARSAKDADPRDEKADADGASAAEATESRDEEFAADPSQQKAERNVLRSLLYTTAVAAADADLASDARLMLVHLLHHFVMVSLSHSHSTGDDAGALARERRPLLSGSRTGSIRAAFNVGVSLAADELGRPCDSTTDAAERIDRLTLELHMQPKSSPHKARQAARATAARGPPPFVPDFVPATLKLPAGSIDPTVMCDAIITCLTDERPGVASLGVSLVRELADTLRVLCGGARAAATAGSAILADISSKLCHACHHFSWRRRRGACQAIAVLARSTHWSWASRHLIGLVRAALFVLKDSPPEAARSTTKAAREAVRELFASVFGHIAPRRGRLVHTALARLALGAPEAALLQMEGLAQSQATAHGTAMLDSAVRSLVVAAQSRSLDPAERQAYMEALSVAVAALPALDSFIPDSAENGGNVRELVKAAVNARQETARLADVLSNVNAAVENDLKSDASFAKSKAASEAKSDAVPASAGSAAGGAGGSPESAEGARHADLLDANRRTHFAERAYVVTVIQRTKAVADLLAIQAYAAVDAICEDSAALAAAVSEGLAKAEAEAAAAAAAASEPAPAGAEAAKREDEAMQHQALAQLSQALAQAMSVATGQDITGVASPLHFGFSDTYLHPRGPSTATATSSEGKTAPSELPGHSGWDRQVSGVALGTATAHGADDGSAVSLLRLVDPWSPPLEAMLSQAELERIDGLVDVLAPDLLSPVAAARALAYELLMRVATLRGQPLSSIMRPHAATLHAQVFSKSLRAMPAATQIGTLHAMALGLSLSPPLFPLSSEMLTRLSEALSITKGLEPKKGSSSHALHAAYSTFEGDSVDDPEQPYSVLLRVAAINLVRAALATHPDAFSTPQRIELRDGYISLFFESLTSESEPVVEVALQALSQVIAWPRRSPQSRALPKELLQNCLRPVLGKLSDYHNLSIHLLRGLSRLLGLLSNYFNATLGQKLLAHLKQWLDPANIIGSRVADPGEEPAIAAAIVDLFHLLPQAPSFLEELVSLVVQLERKLHAYRLAGYVSSPFREPLAKFLNRYHPEAVTFFLGSNRLADPDCGPLFQAILRMPAAAPLRAALVTPQGTQAIIKTTFSKHDDGVPSDTVALLQYRGVQMVSTLARYNIDWLAQNRVVVDCLLVLWRSQPRRERLESDGPNSLRNFQELTMLVKTIMAFCRAVPGDVQPLFALLSAFTMRSSVDFSFLQDFLRHDVAQRSSAEARVAILQQFINDFPNRDVPQAHKVQALRLIVTPMLAHTFTAAQQARHHRREAAAAAAAANRAPTTPATPAGNSDAGGSGEAVATPGSVGGTVVPRASATPEAVADMARVISQETLDKIVSTMLSGDSLNLYSEEMRIELLQLATLLIRHVGRQLMDHRKDLIKFAWHHLKSDDATVKHWAYVNVCRFIEVYETPPKIILQVFVALLRTHQTEAKHLVRMALDVLTPALARRLPTPELVKATKWTKKVVFEEGHGLSQLSHIWTLLVNNAALFYPHRGQFAPQMVNSLSRLGLPPTCPLENRELAVDIAALIAQWEMHRRVSKAARAKREAAKATATSGEEKDKDSGGRRGKRRSGSGAETGKDDDATASEAGSTASSSRRSAKSAAADDDYAPSPIVVEMICNFVVREALLTADTSETKPLSRRCVRLLNSMLQIWPDAVVKVAYFQKLVPVTSSRSGTSITPQTMARHQVDPPATVLAVELTILRALLVSGTQPFMATNCAVVQQLITPAFHSSDTKVMRRLRRFLRAIFARYPPGPAYAAKLPRNFITSLLYPWIGASIARRLAVAAGRSSATGESSADVAKSAFSPATGSAFRPTAVSEADVPVPPPPEPFTQAEMAAAQPAWAAVERLSTMPASDLNTLGVLRILLDVSHRAPGAVETFAVILQQLLSTLLRAHLSGADDAKEAARRRAKSQSTGDGSPAASKEPAIDPETGRPATLCSIVLLVQLLARRERSQLEHTRPFFIAVTQIVQQSADPLLVWVALRVARRWMLAPQTVSHRSSGLTQREKISLLSAMSTLGPSSSPSLASRLAQLGDAALVLQAEYMDIVISLFQGVGGQAGAPGGRVQPPWLMRLLHRPMATGLVSEDAGVRQRTLTVMIDRLRATRMSDEASAAASKPSTRGPGTDADDALDHGAIPPSVAASAWREPGNGAFEALRAVLSMDWQPLEAHAWLSVPVRMLLWGLAAGNSVEVAQSSHFVPAPRRPTEAENAMWEASLAAEAATAEAAGDAAGNAAGDLSGTRAGAGSQASGADADDDMGEPARTSRAARKRRRGADDSSEDGSDLPPAKATKGRSRTARSSKKGKRAVAEKAGDAVDGSEVGEVQRAAAAAAALAAIQEREALRDRLVALLASRQQFFRDTPKPTVASFSESLGELAHASPELSRTLWRRLFPSVWASLSAPQRAALLPHLAALLVRDFHQHQLIVGGSGMAVGAPPHGHGSWGAPSGGDLGEVEAHRRDTLGETLAVGDCPLEDGPAARGFNIVQALMQGIAAARPMPSLRPEVLRYVGKAYGCWNIVIPILERQVLAIPRSRVPKLDGRFSHAADVLDVVDAEPMQDGLTRERVEALCDLYDNLKEADLLAALRVRFCSRPETAVGLALDAHGLHQGAQTIFFDALGNQREREQRDAAGTVSKASRFRSARQQPKSDGDAAVDSSKTATAELREGSHGAQKRVRDRSASPKRRAKTRSAVTKLISDAALAAKKTGRGADSESVAESVAEKPARKRGRASSKRKGRSRKGGGGSGAGAGGGLVETTQVSAAAAAAATAAANALQKRKDAVEVRPPTGLAAVKRRRSKSKSAAQVESTDLTLALARSARRTVEDKKKTAGAEADEGGETEAASKKARKSVVQSRVEEAASKAAEVAAAAAPGKGASTDSAEAGKRIAPAARVAATAAAAKAETSSAIVPRGMAPASSSSRHRSSSSRPVANSTTPASRAGRERSGPVSAVSEFELRVWEDRWTESARQLCQWQVLRDFAKSVGDPLLMAEACSKLGEWEVLRDLLRRPAVALEAQRSPVAKLYEVEVMIEVGRPSQAAMLCDHASVLTLMQWCGTPAVPGAVHSHLLCMAQRVVEAREAVAVAVALRDSEKNQHLPDMQAVLSTWRERLPNRWDGMNTWDALLTWRYHVFSIVTNSLQSQLGGNAQALASVHDAPWTVIKMAHTARKLGLTEVSHSTLLRLFQLTQMDVFDAFHKLREQILVCLESPANRRGGLSILNTTSLDWFNSTQKAELFRLKGVFLNALGDGYAAEAHVAFASAQQVCASYAKGWLSWGIFLDRLYNRLCTSRPLDKGLRGAGQSVASAIAAAEAAAPDGALAAGAKVEKPDARLIAVQALVCFLLAMHHRCDTPQLHVARVLALLAQDNEEGWLGAAFQKYIEPLPHWLWLPWLPQLLTGLARREALHTKLLLKQMAKRYPQAMYYTLRAFLLEKREIPAASGPSGSDGPTIVLTATQEQIVEAVAAGREVAKLLPHSAHASRTTTRTVKLVAKDSGAVVEVPPDAPLSVFTGLVPSMLDVPAAEPADEEAAAKSKQAANEITASLAAVAPVVPSVSHAEELVSLLRRQHQSLASEIESMLEEVIVRFKPEPEEELLSAVHALLTKCFRLPIESPPDEPPPSNLRTTLDRVCRKFFAPETRLKSSKHAAFVARYKSGFEEDFLPFLAVEESEEAAGAGGKGGAASRRGRSRRADASSKEGATRSRSDSIPNPSFPGSLAAVVAKLKQWRARLQRKLAGLCEPLRLEECSSHLAELHATDIHIPGQYGGDGEPENSSLVRLERFDSEVEVLYRHGFSPRRLAMRGNDGRMYHFLVQFAIPHLTRTDERMMQLHQLVNRLLAKHVGAHARHLTLSVPVVVPVTPRVRLLQDSRSNTSLGSVFEAERASRGLDTDSLIVKFRARAVREMSPLLEAAKTAAPSSAAGEGPNTAQLPPMAALTALRAAYLDICDNDVSDLVLTQTMAAVLPAPDAFAAFRVRFAQQLAVSNCLAHVLSVSDRTPQRVLFSQKSGDLVNAEFRPSYSSVGLLVSPDAVPFRLSRNMQALLTPLGVRGPFAASMTELARCLAKREEWVQRYLTLLLRDDLLSWHSSRSPTRPESEQTRLESSLRDRVFANVLTVLRRLRRIAPNEAPKPTPPPSPEQSSSGGAGGKAGKAGSKAGEGRVADGESAEDAAVAAARTPQVSASAQYVTTPLSSVPVQTEAPSADRPFNSHVFDLISAATNPDNLCRSQPTWHPWF